MTGIKTLYNQIFGERSDESWEWEYRDAIQHTSVIDGKTVGHAGFLDYPTARKFEDLMILPEYRGKGIFRELMDVDFPVFGISTPAHKKLLSFGFKEIARLWPSVGFTLPLASDCETFKRFTADYRNKPARFLNWRFSNPDKTYHKFVVDGGYGVLTTVGKMGVVADWEGDFSQVIREAHHHFWNNGIHIMACWGGNKITLMKYGIFPIPIYPLRFLGKNVDWGDWTPSTAFCGKWL